MTTLTAQDLSVRRRGRLILSQISLQAQSGDFIAVIGANGAGKSTLLSALAGLLVPSTGAVLLDGAPLDALGHTELARRRAYLPQNPRCEWPISVERLVALGLTPVLPAFGHLPTAFQPRIDEVLGLCDLLPLRDQAATTLSGGELARAMLARALVGDPSVLIVDEPTTGLDPKHALDAALRLRELARAGKLVIAAIHDVTLVARYATRVLALQAGRIFREGSTAGVVTAETLSELYGVPASIGRTPAGDFVDFLPLERLPP